MNFSKNTLLKISFLTGLVPLVGGVGIFLTWFFARYFFAVDLEQLEPLGFFWMIGCFFLALFGLFLLSIHTIINRKNLKKNILYTLIMILVNIPTVMGVIYLQEQADRNIYIKLINNTNLDNVSFSFVSVLKSKGMIYEENKKVLPLRTLNKGRSTVFYLTPKDDLFYEFRNLSNNLEIEVMSDGKQTIINFQKVEGRRYYDCLIISIDSNFKTTIQ